MEPTVSMRATEEGVVLSVFVQPRAARDSLGGVYRDALKIKTTAPPVDGKANRAVERLIAGWLGIPSGRVEVVAGAGSRSKKVVLRGMTLPEVAAALRHVLSSRPHDTP